LIRLRRYQEVNEAYASWVSRRTLSGAHLHRRDGASPAVPTSRSICSRCAREEWAAAADPAARLVMIDFQRDFCEAGGYADQAGACAWVRPILPRAKRLLDAARGCRPARRAHARRLRARSRPDCHPMKRARSRKAGAEIGSAGPMGRLLIRGEHGHGIIDLLAPCRDEPVIDKATYGAFCRTDLEKILRMRGVVRLAIAGVTPTSACTPRCARRPTGFDCDYVRDAISTSTRGAQGVRAHGRAGRR